MSPAEWFFIALSLALVLGAYALGRADGKHKGQGIANECRADELRQAADRHARYAVEEDAQGRNGEGWRRSANDLRMHAALMFGPRK